MVINKKRAIVSIAATFFLLAAAGVAFAVFTAKSTLADNSLSTGDVSLNISTLTSPTGNCGSFTDSIAGITSTNVVPGGTSQKFFCLRNVSGTADVVLDITASATVTNSEDPNLLDKSLVNVLVKCVGPSGDVNDLNNSTGAINISLTSTDSNLIVPIPKASTVTASTAKCFISQTLSPEATDNAKGKNIHYNLVFNGAQRL